MKRIFCMELSRSVRRFLHCLYLGLLIVLVASTETFARSTPIVVSGLPTLNAAARPASSGALQNEDLEQIKALPSQDERITLLEKLLLKERTDDVREALMKELALRGEQHLREGAPDKASRDFKSVMRVAPADLTDRIFDEFIFPMPVAMNTFGYRTESAELMRSFEPKFANNPGRLIQVGFFYIEIEAPIEAVRVLEKAVSLAPDDHRAHNSLGTAYLI
ncbi:MAG TPA: hypothetical protein VI756_08545, partial [Blastocatellia bacterium]